MSFCDYNKAHEVRADQSIRKKLKFNIASLDVEIDCIYGSHFQTFKGYCKQFAIPEIAVHISQDDIDRERNEHPEMQDPDISVEDRRVVVTYDYGCLEPFVAFRKMADAVIPFDTILMHGSVIEKEGYAYMFTAPSGTGKTTRTQLWVNRYPDSIIVNGDKPFIKFDHNEVLACGSPWSGKEGWNTNTIVPLRAIFLLERGEKDEIEEISLGKAFPFLIQQTHCPVDPDLMRKTIRLLLKLERKVKIYKYRSTPTTKSIEYAFETARQR